MTKLFVELIRAILGFIAALSGLIWSIVLIYWICTHPAKVEFIWHWMWS